MFKQLITSDIFNRKNTKLGGVVILVFWVENRYICCVLSTKSNEVTISVDSYFEYGLITAIN